MDKTKKVANPDTSWNYPQAVGMESRGKAGEQSFAKADTEAKDRSVKISIFYSIF